jgi:hypothetical protein
MYADYHQELNGKKDLMDIQNAIHHPQIDINIR